MFNPHEYANKEILHHIDRLVDVAGLYHDVDPAHVRNLKTRLLHFRWYYGLGSMSRTPLTGEEKSLGEMLTTVGNKEVHAEGFRLNFVDGPHRRNVIRDMKAECIEDHFEHGWMHKPIRVSAMNRWDGAFLTNRKIILTSSQKNEGGNTTKTALLFIDQLQKVVKYPKAFKDEYGVSFVYAHMKDVVDNTHV